MDGENVMYSKRLLITGANGFTGKHACSQLVKEGYTVTAAARNKLKMDDCIQTIQCDLTKEEAVKELIKKANPEYLLHLAGQNHAGESWIHPAASIEVNLMSTVYLMEAVRHVNPDCKIVIAGSALEFNPSDISSLSTPYSLSKTLQVLTARSLAALYKMNVVIARPSNLIGPGYSNGVCSVFARKIVQMEQGKADPVLEVHNLKSRRTFLDVRDAVNAYEICLRAGKPGQIYDISSAVTHSLEDIILLFKKKTAVDFCVNVQCQDEEESNESPMALELKHLGWYPHISLEESLEDILQFYRGNEASG